MVSAAWCAEVGSCSTYVPEVPAPGAWLWISPISVLPCEYLAPHTPSAKALLLLTLPFSFVLVSVYCQLDNLRSPGERDSQLKGYLGQIGLWAVWVAFSRLLIDVGRRPSPLWVAHSLCR